MGVLLDAVRGATMGRRASVFARQALESGWSGRPVARQSKSSGRTQNPAIFGRVAQQDLDQAAFACAEMSLNTPTRQAVQERDRLLSQALFEFFVVIVSS